MQYEPDNNLVKQAYRKVRFEKWFNFVDTEYALGNYDKVLIGLDSALEIFPGHKQCLAIKQQIIQEIKLQNTVAKETITETKKVAQLSPELEKKISIDYESAQSEFEKGNLLEAIKYWENVEKLAPDYQSVKSYLVNAYKYIGVEYYGKNLFDEALEVWRKAIRLEPENSEIHNYIKRTSAEVRKLKELADE